MSYHNGSVWPHDNALIARGLARYGLVEETSRIFSALFDASLFTDQRRMPELFCGFHRRSGEGPVGYPVACSPQAWASASVCALVRALLGLEVSAPRREVRFHRPWLPPSLDALRIRGLEVGEAELDLEVVRTRVGTSVEVMRQEGPVEVDVLKG